ncbi:anthranilate synthase component II [Candidatus Foliamicus sp.]
MLVLIDNYDSFTYNLVHLVGELGFDCQVFRNDAIDPEGVLALEPQAIVLSPGPGYPDSAGICLELVTKAAAGPPLLGVCLGHQAVGQAFGARILRAPRIMHGKLSAIRHCADGLFAGLPQEFQATRYHSLAVERASLPDCFEITAETNDGVIMGLAHREYPLFGVQFHPESIASEHGHALLANFLRASHR